MRRRLSRDRKATSAACTPAAAAGSAGLPARLSRLGLYIHRPSVAAVAARVGGARIPLRQISQLRAAPWMKFVWTEDDIADLPLKGVRGAV